MRVTARQPRARHLAAALVGIASLGGTTVVVPLYDSGASEGSREVEADVVTAFADDSIEESSGLVLRGDTFFTVNDSGSDAEVYAVDARTGETTGVTRYADEEPVDVEALAPGRGDALWVGDIGDNQRARSFLTVHRLLARRGGGTFDADSFELVYPDGPHDAETLLVHPHTGRIHVVTKRPLVGGEVYQAPARLVAGRRHVLRLVGRVPGLVTDGTFLPSGRHVLLRTYGSAGVYTFPDLEEAAFFPLPEQEQGEGVAVGPPRRGSTSPRVYLSSEGTHAEVLAMDLPPLRAGMSSPASPAPSASPSASPEAANPASGDRTTRGGGGAWGYLAVGGAVLAALGLVLRAARRRGRRMR